MPNKDFISDSLFLKRHGPPVCEPVMETAADDGLGAESVETMAKVKLRDRRQSANIHSFSDAFRDDCENLVGGLDVEVVSQSLKTKINLTTDILPIFGGNLCETNGTV